MPPNVLLLRGNTVCDWDLRPLEALKNDFQFRLLVPTQNWFATDGIDLPQQRVFTRATPVPGALPNRIICQRPWNRMLATDKHFEWSDVVHTVEIGNWFSGQAALARKRHNFKLVVSAWETLPHRATYRNRGAERNRQAVLEQTDLFIPWTDRARDCLILEGVEPERMVVTRTGVDVKAFSDVAAAAPVPTETVIVSPGRLVWGKGHLDVMRAIAALADGVVPLEDGVALPRVVFLGSGREGERFKRYAADLGIAEQVEFREHVPYDQVPHEFAKASMMVLASLPNTEWEEQFGFVLVEAMAAGLPIAASTSGAIPEVVNGAGRMFSPGDWIGLAKIFAEAHRLRDDQAMNEARERQLRLYSLDAAAERYAAAYHRALGSG